MASKKVGIKKIVLINPPMRLEQVYGSFSEWGSVSPPTGLCYIASYLRDKGYNVSIVDAEALGWGIENTVQEVLKINPDIVGITCKTLWVVNAHRVAQALKKAAPGLVIVAGGNHVTALPEKSLREFTAFDMLIIGEGEETFLELIKAINEGKSLNGIEGLAFRSGEQIVIGPRRKRISNLDELPLPAYDLLPELPKHYKPVLSYVEKLPAFSIVVSRGCPSQCTFCDRGVFGNRVTIHSPEYIVELIRQLEQRYGIRYITFDDDNLLLSKHHLLRLLDKLEKSGLCISFTCQSRVDTVDKERLYSLKKAGCRIMLFGIESGSQKILDTMKKNITIDQIKKAVAFTKKSGIKTMGFFILGYPGETEETLKETAELIRACKFDDIGVFFFTPLPGSEIYENIRNYGVYEEDWERTNSMDQIVFVPHGLTKDILKKYSDLCFKTCYLQLHQFLFAYRRIASIAHLKATMRSIPKIIFGWQG